MKAILLIKRWRIKIYRFYVIGSRKIQSPRYEPLGTKAGNCGRHGVFFFFLHLACLLVRPYGLSQSIARRKLLEPIKIDLRNEKALNASKFRKSKVNMTALTKKKNPRKYAHLKIKKSQVKFKTNYCDIRLAFVKKFTS